MGVDKLQFMFLLNASSIKIPSLSSQIPRENAVPRYFSIVMPGVLHIESEQALYL